MAQREPGHPSHSNAVRMLIGNGIVRRVSGAQAGGAQKRVGSKLAIDRRAPISLPRSEHMLPTTLIELAPRVLRWTGLRMRLEKMV
jgi:hypothetical protein